MRDRIANPVWTTEDAPSFLGAKVNRRCELTGTESVLGKSESRKLKAEIESWQAESARREMVSEKLNHGRLTAEFGGRTKSFASRTIRFFVALPQEREEVRVLGRQLLRSGTSVAAQVREAARARSAAEFCSKLEGAIQEADESQLWLELLWEDCAVQDPEQQSLHAEAGELIAILVSMVNKTKAKLRAGS